eukprot:TRINITY_DN1748_c0_g1_i1.p1 TRINITY_DN1748_c0_g1~~TRINITY_DN1748_c0_g1_i1.p1  ORF type:complete len:2131 (-),score=185.70 TRINITY_DN1748_c0_g1_i1:50-6442(-)
MANNGVFENQARKTAMANWEPAAVPWCNNAGSCTPADQSAWQVSFDTSPTGTDHLGWAYATHFGSTACWGPLCLPEHTARRRLWLPTETLIYSAPYPTSPVALTSTTATDTLTFGGYTEANEQEDDAFYSPSHGHVCKTANDSGEWDTLSASSSDAEGESQALPTPMAHTNSVPTPNLSKYPFPVLPKPSPCTVDDVQVDENPLVSDYCSEHDVTASEVDTRCRDSFVSAASYVTFLSALPEPPRLAVRVLRGCRFPRNRPAYIRLRLDSQQDWAETSLARGDDPEWNEEVILMLTANGTVFNLNLTPAAQHVITGNQQRTLKLAAFSMKQGPSSPGAPGDKKQHSRFIGQGWVGLQGIGAQPIRFRVPLVVCSSRSLGKWRAPASGDCHVELLVSCHGCGIPAAPAFHLPPVILPPGPQIRGSAGSNSNSQGGTTARSAVSMVPEPAPPAPRPVNQKGQATHKRFEVHVGGVWGLDVPQISACYAVLSIGQLSHRTTASRPSSSVRSTSSAQNFVEWNELLRWPASLAEQPSATLSIAIHRLARTDPETGRPSGNAASTEEDGDIVLASGALALSGPFPLNCTANREVTLFRPNTGGTATLRLAVGVVMSSLPAPQASTFAHMSEEHEVNNSLGAPVDVVILHGSNLGGPRGSRYVCVSSAEDTPDHLRVHTTCRYGPYPIWNETLTVSPLLPTGSADAELHLWVYSSAGTQTKYNEDEDELLGYGILPVSTGRSMFKVELGEDSSNGSVYVEVVPASAQTTTNRESDCATVVSGLASPASRRTPKQGQKKRNSAASPQAKVTPDIAPEPTVHRPPLPQPQPLSPKAAPAIEILINEVRQDSGISGAPLSVRLEFGSTHYQTQPSNNLEWNEAALFTLPLPSGPPIVRIDLVAPQSSTVLGSGLVDLSQLTWQRTCGDVELRVKLLANKAPGTGHSPTPQVGVAALLIRQVPVGAMNDWLARISELLAVDREATEDRKNISQHEATARAAIAAAADASLRTAEATCKLRTATAVAVPPLASPTSPEALAGPKPQTDKAHEPPQVLRVRLHHLVPLPNACAGSVGLSVQCGEQRRAARWRPADIGAEMVLAVMPFPAPADALLNVWAHDGPTLLGHGQLALRDLSVGGPCRQLSLALRPRQDGGNLSGPQTDPRVVLAVDMPATAAAPVKPSEVEKPVAPSYLPAAIVPQPVQSTPQPNLSSGDDSNALVVEITVGAATGVPVGPGGSAVGLRLASQRAQPFLFTRSQPGETPQWNEKLRVPFGPNDRRDATLEIIVVDLATRTQLGTSTLPMAGLGNPGRQAATYRLRMAIKGPNGYIGAATLTVRVEPQHTNETLAPATIAGNPAPQPATCPIDPQPQPGHAAQSQEKQTEATPQVAVRVIGAKGRLLEAPSGGLYHCRIRWPASRYVATRHHTEPNWGDSFQLPLPAAVATAYGGSSTVAYFDLILETAGRGEVSVLGSARLELSDVVWEKGEVVLQQPLYSPAFAGPLGSLHLGLQATDSDLSIVQRWAVTAKQHPSSKPQEVVQTAPSQELQLQVRVRELVWEGESGSWWKCRLRFGAGSATTSLPRVLMPDRVRWDQIVALRSLPHDATPSVTVQILESGDRVVCSGILDLRSVASATCANVPLQPRGLLSMEVELSPDTLRWLKNAWEGIRLSPNPVKTPQNVTQPAHAAEQKVELKAAPEPPARQLQPVKQLDLSMATATQPVHPLDAPPTARAPTPTQRSASPLPVTSQQQPQRNLQSHKLSARPPSRAASPVPGVQLPNCPGRTSPAVPQPNTGSLRSAPRPPLPHSAASNPSLQETVRAPSPTALAATLVAPEDHSGTLRVGMTGICGCSGARITLAVGQQSQTAIVAGHRKEFAFRVPLNSQSAGSASHSVCRSVLVVAAHESHVIGGHVPPAADAVLDLSALVKNTLQERTVRLRGGGTLQLDLLAADFGVPPPSTSGDIASAERLARMAVLGTEADERDRILLEIGQSKAELPSGDATQVAQPRNDQASSSAVGIGLSLRETRKAGPRGTVERQVVVTAVAPHSCAHAAGLLPEDVVIAFGSSRVESRDRLAKMMRDSDPGAVVAVTVVRNGKQLRKQLTLAAIASGNSVTSENGGKARAPTPTSASLRLSGSTRP